jgi:hypothetical protein
MKRLFGILLILLGLFLLSGPCEIIKTPRRGDPYHLRGDTNQYVVVVVPSEVYQVNCLINGTNCPFWLTNGPTFLGISPTNAMDKLIIVPWPPQP